MSDNNSSSSSSSGIGFCGALFILFLGLKLCGVITWSWWWVIAPLWAGFVVALGLIFLFVIILFCAEKITNLAQNKRK
jgi:hypothetical protein